MTFQLFSIDNNNRSSGGGCQSVTVVGFGDRAFLLVPPAATLATATVLELLPPTVNESPNQKQQQQKQQIKQDVCAVAVYCQKRGDNEELMNGESDCCCIVARTDKSLCVYAVKQSDTSSSSSSTTVTGISPTFTHRSPKRVTSLTFGSLPLSSSSSATNDVPVLITADVVGDSYAYSLDRHHKGTRLLLGHTASMLTGVKTISMELTDSPHRHKQFVLTSDRDEKIRISYFPETYKIYGYLLGHTEYITSFDVATVKENTVSTNNSSGTSSSSMLLAVSCGGDATIRLWDIELKQELCVVNLDDDSNEDDEDDPSSAGEGHQSNSLSPSTSSKRIPTDISINESGTLVGVIFDGCSDIEIYRVNLPASSLSKSSTSSSQYSLSIACTTTCDGQPLSINFAPDQNDTIIVVMQEPTFVKAYQIMDSTYIDKKSNETVSPSSLTDSTVWNDWFQPLRSYATSSKITMPSTILEKDENGNPKIQRAMETRGPSNSRTQDGKQLPWNRVERIGSAKRKESRRHKRRKLAAAEEQQSTASSSTNTTTTKTATTNHQTS